MNDWSRFEMKSWLKKFSFVRNIHKRWISKTPFNFCTRKVKGFCNQINVDAQVIWRSSIHINGSNNSVTINNAKLISKLNISVVGDNNNVIIGLGCQIKECIILIEGNSNTCQIGNQTTIEAAELYLTENNTTIAIGNDCMLADSIVFRTGDSHSILDIQTGCILNPAGDITIGDHVWIGQGVTFLCRSRFGYWNS